MKNHTKIYFKAFGYDESSFVPCEVCGKRAVDIHHIEARGMGGDKKAEGYANLMALCRECHVEMGDKRDWMDFLQVTHRAFMLKHVI